jgi:hypothetical protein
MAYFMAQIIDGKQIATDLKLEIAKEVLAIKNDHPVATQKIQEIDKLLQALKAEKEIEIK